MCFLDLQLIRRYTVMKFSGQNPASDSTVSPGPSGFISYARELNDSLYELYKPVDTPSMYIIFLHGLHSGDNRDPHLSTWQSGDGSCLWPQTWLIEKFPGAHVLSVSYTAHVNKNVQGEFDMYNIGENLLSDILEANIGQAPYCPVILVGHCFGGFVIKELCNRAHNTFNRASGEKKSKLEKFLENIRGIYYYGTPHHGSPLMNKKANHLGSNLLEYFKFLSKSGTRLNADFEQLRRLYPKWLIHGLGESGSTKSGFFQGVVGAPEASSRYGDSFNVVEADHIQICRPEKKTNRSFYGLVELLDSIAKTVKILEEPENYQRTESVGIESALEDVKEKLKSKSTTLALVGMGGIGKTTLAKELFNAVGDQYTCTCFVEDVKKIAGSLEDAIMNKMHVGARFGGYKVSEDDRKKGFKSFLTREKLLLVLDDVDSKALKMVEDIKLIVDEESRIVTTSRNKGLYSFGPYLVYDVPQLTEDNSKVLFCKSAFASSKGNPGAFTEYAAKIVNKCGGLPLALDVIGKFLSRKEEPIWKDTLHALDRANVGSNMIEEQLWAVLRISYDGLADFHQKNVFLDAATVFYGCELSFAQTAWKSIMEEGPHLMWSNLIDLSLVKEDVDGEQTTIGMHDQLLNLGRKIASEKNENNERRIWNDAKAAKALLSRENHNAAKETVALKYCGSELNIQDIYRVESNMQNLDRSESNIQNIDRSESDIQNIEAPLLDSQHMKSTGGDWLNSSVYQLHLPRENPGMQVVFFHGFQLQGYDQAHVNTWKSRDGSAVWPETWLVEEFPEAQVLSVSFNRWMTNALGNIDSSNMMTYLLAQVLSVYCKRPITNDYLLSDLLRANIGKDRSCPVILVGHGFGALVIEELCLHIERQINVVKDPSKLKNFMESVRGIFFYAPIPFPISENVRDVIAAGNPCLAEYVSTVSTRAASVELDFSSLTEKYSWHGEVLGAEDQFKYQFAQGKREMRALQERPPFSAKDVERQYARYRWGFSLQDDADHITITRPTTKSDKSFTAFMDFLRKIKSEGTSSTPDNRASILGTQLCKMEKLQYLWLEGVDVDTTTQGIALPQTLVYLHLCKLNWSAFSCNPLPETLAILQLKDLSGLQTLPTNFDKLSSLQILSVESNDDLEKFPDSLGKLQSLRNIRIKGCKLLKELPGSFLILQKLEQIELLEMYLKTIPDVKKLRSLRTLVVSWGKYVRFPKLPRCLQSLVTELNFSHLPLTLDVVGGESTREFRERYSNSNIVGIYPILQSLEAKLLDTTSRVALVGMAGIGKTTLARELFRVLGWRYSYTCFLDNVKSISGSLEDALLRQMRHDQGEISEEKRGGLELLNGEQLLLVLDDVDPKGELQVSNLLKSIANVHEDSRFIVTCVDCDFSNFEKFHVQPLLRNNSIELFNVHAFKDGDPSSLRQYAHEIVRKCGGIPFNLEVIGKYLNNKPKSTWDSIPLALE